MEILERVAEMAKTKSWQEIIDNFILPEVLKKSGAPRGYKISDDFMSIVAENIVFIRMENKELADVMLELAMQRISCGAVKHPYLGTMLKLPVRYAYYSTIKDKPAPMNDACFDFLQRGLPYGFSASPKIKEHAEAILFGLIFNLDYKTGKPLNNFNLSEVNTPSYEIMKWAWSTAKCFVAFDLFWRKLIGDDWRKYRAFFVENRNKISVKELHQELVVRYPPQKIWRELAKEDWEYHIGFFHTQWSMIDKKEFFEIIGVTNLLQKAKISRRIKNYTY